MVKLSGIEVLGESIMTVFHKLLDRGEDGLNLILAILIAIRESVGRLGNQRLSIIEGNDSYECLIELEEGSYIVLEYEKGRSPYDASWSYLNGKVVKPFIEDIKQLS